MSLKYIGDRLKHKIRDSRRKIERTENRIMKDRKNVKKNKKKREKRTYSFLVILYKLYKDTVDVYGHITLKIPVLVRSPKSSNVERG